MKRLIAILLSALCIFSATAMVVGAVEETTAPEETIAEETTAPEETTVEETTAPETDTETVADTTAPETTVPAEKPESPQTGDDMLLAIVVASLALTACSAVVIYRKKAN